MTKLTKGSFVTGFRGKSKPIGNLVRGFCDLPVSINGVELEGKRVRRLKRREKRGGRRGKKGEGGGDGRGRT